MRTLAFMGLYLSLMATESLAATVVFGDTAPGGIPYTWVITMGDNDNASAINHVGALSHNDPINFGDPVGTAWTHTSNWVALELSAAADLSITLTRKAGVPNGASTAGTNLFPAFTIYSGWDNDGGDYHVYNNATTFDWAEDLTSVIGAEHNGLAAGTNTPGLGLSSVSHTFTLSPGLYSIALGGNPPDSIGSGRQGYELSLTTTAVPEVSALVLGCIAVLGIAATRIGHRFTKSQA